MPNVGSGFDCGAACFDPCEEYKKNGWEDFVAIEDIYNPNYSKIDIWWK